VYVGYLSNNFVIIPAINYERHGIVSYRPAEVKIEFRLDLKYNYNDIWFSIYYENQFESFLGFPDYFYVDNNNLPVNGPNARLANSRTIDTIIFSVSKKLDLNF